MTSLPIHTHDFRHGDVVFLAFSTAPLQIKEFVRDGNGPWKARCFFVRDPRQTTQDFAVSELFKNYQTAFTTTRQ